jgi:hypothetical protein
MKYTARCNGVELRFERLLRDGKDILPWAEANNAKVMLLATTQ